MNADAGQFAAGQQVAIVQHPGTGRRRKARAAGGWSAHGPPECRYSGPESAPRPAPDRPRHPASCGAQVHRAWRRPPGDRTWSPSNTTAFSSVPPRARPVGAHRDRHPSWRQKVRLSRQFAHKGAVGHVQPTRLLPDRRIGKVDAKVDFQHVGRFQPRHSLAIAHFDGLQHPDGADRAQLAAGCPRARNACNKGRGRAVKDRHFRPVNLDQGIVDGTDPPGPPSYVRWSKP